MTNNYEHFDSWDSLIKAVIAWGKERRIDNPHTQALKWVEEVGETIGELNHGRVEDEYEDGLGDALVSQTILADITGKDLFSCFERAYNEIKDRHGKTIGGNFLKDE